MPGLGPTPTPPPPREGPKTSAPASGPLGKPTAIPATGSFRPPLAATGAVGEAGAGSGAGVEGLRSAAEHPGEMFLRQWAGTAAWTGTGGGAEAGASAVVEKLRSSVDHLGEVLWARCMGTWAQAGTAVWTETAVCLSGASALIHLSNPSGAYLTCPSPFSTRNRRLQLLGLLMLLPCHPPGTHPAHPVPSPPLLHPFPPETGRNRRFQLLGWLVPLLGIPLMFFLYMKETYKTDNLIEELRKVSAEH